MTIESTFGNLALAQDPYCEDTAKRKTALRENFSREDAIQELWASKDVNALKNIVVLDGKDVGATLLTKVDSRTPNDPISFQYSANDRLVQATKGLPGSETILGQYDYNHEGNRIRHRFSDRGDVDYYYDDGAVLEERNAADDSLLAYYQYADRLIALAQPLGTQYYHHDALGSTIGLTDQNGADKKSYHLDPWGNIRWETGTSDNRHVFTGKEHDKNTGLVYFGARYYDPEIGRFITQDTYLGENNTPPSLHRYLYAHSNPTVFIDLQGYDAAEVAKKTAGPLGGTTEMETDFPDEEEETEPKTTGDRGDTASTVTADAKATEAKAKTEPRRTREEPTAEQESYEGAAKIHGIHKTLMRVSGWINWKLGLVSKEHYEYNMKRLEKIDDAFTTEGEKERIAEGEVIGSVLVGAIILRGLPVPQPQVGRGEQLLWGKQKAPLPIQKPPQPKLSPEPVKVKPVEPPTSPGKTPAARMKPTVEGKTRTPTDRYKEQLFERAGKKKSQTSLDAARRELTGEKTGFDHVTKVRNAQRGLVNRIQQIKRKLGNPSLEKAEQQALQKELSKASRLLDHSKKYVP